MSADTELLRRYVEERSEAAFAELVRLHLNLVYFAALRQVGGDAHRAKDVAQTVFTDLARKAASLTGRATLTGWLHTSTRFAAAKLRRADFSRQQYEQEATTMNALLSDPAPAADWERLRPMIDDAIHELDERDREAVLLRFFENRPFAEIGATLRLSDDAARMRVDRALEKLRAALARRGVKSTGAALATVFANQVAASTPAGLAASISGAALASAATVGGLAVAGAGIFMSLKSTAILSAVALAAIVATFFQWSRAYRAESELAALTVDRDGLRADLRAEEQRAAQNVAALKDELAAVKTKLQLAASVAPAVTPRPTLSPAAQLPDNVLISSQQKAMLNNLRQLTAARDQFELENGRPPASLDELVGETKYVRRLNPVDGERYDGIALTRGQPMTVTSANGVTVTYDPIGGTTTKFPSLSPEQQMAEMAAILPAQVGANFIRAVQAYRAANGDSLPKNQQTILSYFTTPQEAADFVEAIEAAEKARGVVRK